MIVKTTKDSVFIGDFEIKRFLKFKNSFELASFVGVHEECVALARAASETSNKESEKFVEDEITKPTSANNGRFDLLLCDVSSARNFDIKVYNKALTERFGCTPSKFLKLVNGVIHKTFITERYEDKFVRRFCMSPMRGGRSFRLNPERVSRLGDCYEKLVQSDRDGLHNILPFVFFMNETPEKLKKIFGDYAWKQISKFSPSRNMLLAETFCPLIGLELAQDPPEGFEGPSPTQNVHQLASRAVKLPSTLYRHARSLGSLEEFVDAIEYCALNYKGQWGNPTPMYRVILTFLETSRALARLGRKVNSKWSPRRLKEEHDNAAVELTNQSYPNVRFGWIDAWHMPTTFAHPSGYTAKVLVTEREIGVEGKAMGHCVGFYAKKSADAGYVVVSISEPNGSRHSTLGLTRDSYSGMVAFQQHYMAYNNPVECQSANEFALQITNRINQLAQEERTRLSPNQINQGILLCA